MHTCGKSSAPDDAGRAYSALPDPLLDLSVPFAAKDKGWKRGVKMDKKGKWQEGKGGENPPRNKS